MRKLIIIAGILFITSSCSFLKGDKINYFKPEIKDKALTNWENIIGKWYGISKIENGQTREFIDERKSDGTYYISFRTIDKNGKISVQSEFGEWGISGDIYFTILKGMKNNNYEQIADSSDPYTKDAYEILKLTEAIFTYKHASSGDKFSVKKVDSQFKFNK